MSDISLKLKVSRLVLQSGFTKEETMISPLMKIIQMRHKEVDKQQALRVIKCFLEERQNYG